MNLRKLNKPTALCLSLVIILSMLTIFGSTAIPVKAATAGSFDFGNTTIGTLTNYFRTDRDASQFQLTQSGILQSITAYFQTSGFNAKTAIYTDDNGEPSTLIAQSSSQTVTSSGWKTFTVPQTSLNGGYYWLCVVSDTSESLGAMTPTSTNTHAWKFAPYSTDYSSTFGTPAGYEKTVTSIYATLSASTSNPTPTPSPTPTNSPTPTPSSSGALTQVAVYGATASSYSGTYTPNLAIDGIESSSNYWGTTSALNLPQWLQLDLGSQRSICQTTTHFYDRDSRTYTYYIQVSGDGSTWNTVVSTRTGIGIVTDTFNSVTARYVRITITGNTANLAAHIEEIKIYQSTDPNYTPAPTATPAPAPIATPTPAPTATPTPVPITYSTSSAGNGLWTQAGSSLTPTQCAFYVSKHISYIYMEVGYWKSDNSIYYFISPEQMQSAIANAHAAGLKVFADIASQVSYGDQIDIGTASLRQTAINNMVNLVKTNGFDGMAEDAEEPNYNVFSDYVAYFNAATVAMHSIGKQYFTSVISYMPQGIGASLFSQIKVDRLTVMLYCYPLYPYSTSNPVFTYDFVQAKFKEQMDFTLRYSSSPVGLGIHYDYVAYGKLTDAMTWIDQQIANGTPTSKLAGMDIFWQNGMTQSQWDSWSNWNTKG